MSSRFIMPFADVGSGIKPSSGAQLFFFEDDGVTPKDTFSDQLSMPTPNTNPVISDSNGVFSDIYIVGSYKVTLKDKNGSQIFGLALVSSSVDTSTVGSVAVLPFANVTNMLDGAPIRSEVGNQCSTGGTTWLHVSGDGSSLPNFSALSDIVFEDFAASEVDNITTTFSEANTAAVSSGKWLITNGSDYKLLSWTPINGTKIKGDSTLSTYAGGMYFGQNMIEGTLIDGFKVRGVTLDGRNDALSIVGAGDAFDNIIHFMSAKNVDIQTAKFKRAVRHFAWFNATVTDKTENLKFSDNDVEDGAMDAVTVRRYGDNIKINKNRMKNVTNQAKGGDVAAKSISVSGSRNVRIRDNDVVDDQGNSSTIIIEFIDVPCIDVIVEGNSVNGSSSNGFKVGASEDVTVRDNFAENCDSSYYIEGNKRITIDNNHAKNTQSIGFFLTQDFDTGLDNEDVTFINNTSVNANLAGLTVGVPPSSAGNKFSYHMWVENTTILKIENNNFSDPAGHVAGGLAVASEYDSIKDNNLSGLHASAVVFYSNFADGSKGQVENNQGMQTTNQGVVTALNGTSQTNVIHDVLGTATSSQTGHFNAIPAAALSGTITYWNAQLLDFTTFAIRTRNSVHGAANVTLNTDFMWSMKLVNPKGIYGKTVR